MIALPAALEKNRYPRQYYGTVSHNAKGPYTRITWAGDAESRCILAPTPAESARSS